MPKRKPAPAKGPTDTERIDWLQEQITDTIYLDDGRIVDVKGLDVRKAIDAEISAKEKR